MRRRRWIERSCVWLLAVTAAGGLLIACNGSSNQSDQAPAISVPATQTVMEGQPLSFTAVGSDPDSGTLLHYGLQGAPQGAAIDSLTGVFTWTPTFDEIGTHVITCTVSDGLLSANAVVVVQVLPDAAVDDTAPLPGGTLDPLAIPKYVTPLVIPPVMKNDGSADSYAIAARQFKQQILPGGIWNTLDGRADAFPPTTVWGYGPDADPLPDSSTLGGAPGVAPAANSQFNFPGYTLETRADVPVKVRWINDLVDGNGNYLPPLLTVDQTLHWANPPQVCADGRTATDCMGNDPTPYTGPVPLVTHLHGAHVDWTSDGYPEAWWLPAAADIPSDYARKGGLFGDATGTNPGNLGFADYEYRNDQPATTLWYHDHALGMTRTNVYAGLAGYWLIRGDHTPVGGGAKVTDSVDDAGSPAANDGVLPGPAPTAGEATLAVNSPGDPVRNALREIPILIQDRSFNADGSFFYPTNRSYFEGLESPANLLIDFAPDSDIAPLWNPEVFFNVMVVNGVSWPKLEVAQAKYRFRLLNGCNSRFLNLALFVVDPATGRVDPSREIPFYVIGYEQGPLPNVVKISTGFATALAGDGNVPAADQAVPDPDQALLMAPAERPDVLVDFSGLPNGTVVRMVNTGPDDPFDGFNGIAGEEAVADPLTTGQIMQFVVNSALTGASPTDPNGATPATAIENLVLNPEVALGVTTRSLQVSLNEEESDQVCVVGGFGGTTILQLDDVDPSDFAKSCEDAGGTPFAPKAALLGTVAMVGVDPQGVPLRWTDQGGESLPVDVQLADGSTVQIKVTENPTVGDTEEWQIYNFTEDAHPIHLHLVRFQVIGRTLFDGATPSPHNSVQLWETGYKDMVIAYPGEVTTVKATFDIPGLYVWHCHILEHEDNEMMRPYVVSPAP